jgi:hypothetical protein
MGFLTFSCIFNIVIMCEHNSSGVAGLITFIFGCND